LAAGSFAAQGLMVLASPILSRIYSAQEFGLLATFTSIAVIAALVGTGRYEYAIGLAKEEREATSLVALVTGLSFVFSTALLLLLLGLALTGQLAEPVRGGLWTVIAIPLYTLMAAAISALTYWHQRRKKYSVISLSSVIQSVGTVGMSLALGLLGLKHAGLVAGVLAGQAGILFCLAISFGPELAVVRSLDWQELRRAASGHRNFPKFMVFSDLASTAGVQMSPLFLSSLYGSQVVGLYALGNRVLRGPGIVIVSSIANVFRNEAIDAINVSGGCREVFSRTFKWLLFAGIPIFSLVALFAPSLFAIIFGEPWRFSGNFARLLCLSTLADFICLPFVCLFYLRGRQQHYARLQILNLVLSLFAGLLAHRLVGSPLWSIAAITAVGTAFNIIFVVKAYALSDAQA